MYMKNLQIIIISFQGTFCFFFFTGSINRSILVKVKKGDGEGARDQSPGGRRSDPNYK